MGVHIPNLDFLLRFRGRKLGDTVMLGRQGFHIPLEPERVEYRAAKAVLEQYDPGAKLETLVGSDGYCEPLFKFLGSTAVSSIDASPFEGADIIHDLNDPVPSSLHDKFDCIFDGGTIEHIYDVPMVFRNVDAMLRVGGLFLTSMAANNFLGHGFYQFSPELLWRVFSQTNGYYIEMMQLVDESNEPQPKPVEDPKIAGRRDEIRGTKGCTLLLMAARKLWQKADRNSVQQSDYQSAWQGSQVAATAGQPG